MALYRVHVTVSYDDDFEVEAADEYEARCEAEEMALQQVEYPGSVDVNGWGVELIEQED